VERSQGSCTKVICNEPSVCHVAACSCAAMWDDAPLLAAGVGVAVWGGGPPPPLVGDADGVVMAAPGLCVGEGVEAAVPLLGVADTDERDLVEVAEAVDDGDADGWACTAATAASRTRNRIQRGGLEARTSKADAIPTAPMPQDEDMPTAVMQLLHNRITEAADRR